MNRHLAGVFGFYDHHARADVGVAGELVAWRRVSRGSYKPFLHHVTKGRPIPVRPVKLIVTRRVPRTLDAGQVAAILAACERLRDRFLFALLAETGMRVGNVGARPAARRLRQPQAGDPHRGPPSSRRDSRSQQAVRVIRRKTNRRHMTGDHHGRTARRATLLAIAADEILGTHSR